jgi:hypothetical protein
VDSRSQTPGKEDIIGQSTRFLVASWSGVDHFVDYGQSFYTVINETILTICSAGSAGVVGMRREEEYTHDWSVDHDFSNDRECCRRRNAAIYGDGYRLNQYRGHLAGKRHDWRRRRKRDH